MKVSDWISVKDKLPRTADYVFVCRECDGERWTSLAAYVIFEEYAHWYDPQGFDIHDVTHWQKIVLPKKEIFMKKPIVIFADLDGTLIKTHSGLPFPQGIWDMRFNFPALDMIRAIQPKCLLIVTNQGGIEKGFVNERNFTFKMEYICRSIKEYTGVHTEYSYCTSNDPDNKYRKPNIGMIDPLMIRMIKKNIVENGISSDDILMIGDASGKDWQFSDSDKKCAEKSGFHYMDIEDFIQRDDFLND